MLNMLLICLFLRVLIVHKSFFLYLYYSIFYIFFSIGKIKSNILYQIEKNHVDALLAK